MTHSQNLLQTIVDGLLGPEVTTQIVASEEGEALRITLYLPESAKGRVFGRGGRTARSIRTLIRQVAPRNVRRVYLDIETLPTVDESEFFETEAEIPVADAEAQQAFTGTEPEAV